MSWREPRFFALAALILLATCCQSAPYSGHFTLIRPNGQTIQSSYIYSSSGSGANSPRPLSPTYYIKLGQRNSAGDFMPGVGYIPDPPIDRPFFSVDYRANGRPFGLYTSFPFTRNQLIPLIDMSNNAAESIFSHSGATRQRINNIYGAASARSGMVSALEMANAFSKRARNI